MKLQYLATVTCDVHSCKGTNDYARPMDDLAGYRSWDRPGLMMGMAREHFEGLGWTFVAVGPKEEGGIASLCPTHKPKGGPS